jgi:hypothetical protein
MDTEPSLEAQFIALQTLTIAAVRMMQVTLPEFAEGLLESTRQSRDKFRGTQYSTETVAAFAAEYEKAWDDLLARVIVTRGSG